MKSDLLSFLREQRHIFFICPCCGEVGRLSDSRISYLRRYADDWFDRLERAEEGVEGQVERFREREGEIRRQSVERARKRVLPQLLRRVTPSLARLKISPMDVKTLLDPVAYVAFDGLNSSRGTRRVVFLDKPATDGREKLLQESMVKTIEKGSIGWTTVRIDRDGSATADGQPKATAKAAPE